MAIPVILLSYFGFVPLAKLEDFTKDLRSIFGRKTPIASDLVLLTIDDQSLQLDGVMDDEIAANPIFQEMRKGWPWSRSVHAAVLDKLIGAGAKFVAFDLLFPSPGRGDEAFSAALHRHAGKVLIAGAFEGTDTATPSFNRPTASLLEPGKDDASIGFATFVPDSDGTVRSAIFQASPEDFAGRSHSGGETRFASLSSRILQQTRAKVTLPASANVPFRFGGPPRSYVHHSLYEILLPGFWQQNYQNGAFFKDKIVIIGPEGSWSHDEHPTPFALTLDTQELMSGPELHLHALAAARAGEFLHLPERLSVALSIALAAVLGASISGVARTPLSRCLVVGLLLAGYGYGAQIAFDDFGQIIPVAAPVLAFALTFLGGLFVEFSTERRERLRSRALLERYVSSSVASEILDSPRSYLTSLVGIRKPVTVLFTDIRNFTAMANLLDAGELVAQLNEFYEKIIEDVFQNSGTLDKIMGDGMMAVWGNLRSDGPDLDARSAVRAALAIQTSLVSLNRDWAVRGKPPLELGIGIAQGSCIVGNIGSERKMDLTVIGDAANLAARLQALTRENGETMLFDQNVAELVAEAFPIKELSTVNIRGFSLPISLFTVR